MKPKDSPRVVIVGFMAAGKSTVARELARRLGERVVDLDDSVAAAEGRTPQQLIDEEGEGYFREAETGALGAALASGAARVVALGGGAWARGGNRELIARHDCFIIWLDAPFELCWERITSAADNSRPFARDREHARRLYEERRASYELADCRVDAGGSRDAATIASEIESHLREPPPGARLTRTKNEEGESEDG